jgi:hypothetical protein
MTKRKINARNRLKMREQSWQRVHINIGSGVLRSLAQSLGVDVE